MIDRSEGTSWARRIKVRHLESFLVLDEAGTLRAAAERLHMTQSAMSHWLEHAIDHASRDFFGQPAMYMGEGGTIPFMGMLGEKFPGAQFMITGVLGPHSNAHGPNEFLHIPTGKRVTSAVACVVAAHQAASVAGLTRGSAAAAGDSRFGDHASCC
mgnify:CR=1 FL=1